MSEVVKGKVVGVNGNLLRVRFDSAVTQNEVAYAVVGDIKLKAEVIRVRGAVADLQVFEDTTDLRVGSTVEFSRELLSVELGPGLLGSIYDGLQNPLPDLAEQCGFFLQRGKYLDPLNRKKSWEFKPAVKAGDTVTAESGVRAGDIVWFERTASDQMVIHVYEPDDVRADGSPRFRVVAGQKPNSVEFVPVD